MAQNQQLQQLIFQLQNTLAVDNTARGQAEVFINQVSILGSFLVPRTEKLHNEFDAGGQQRPGTPKNSQNSSKST